ncbi:MAG TPA: ATP-binding protein [Polyangiaceae bacterium]
MERYLSSAIVRSILQRSLRERHITPEQFRRGDTYKIYPLLRKGIALFVSERDRERALEELTDLCDQTRPAPLPCEIRITSENDISVVRNEARRVCEEAGAESYTIQKVTTIVSELARNIVSYANEGKVEIVPVNNGKRRIVVRASDRGRGIPNLDVVMSGHYQSKTGLGRGLVGTKRLADDFDIKTGPMGTMVMAEVLV